MACSSCGKKKSKTKPTVYSGASLSVKSGYTEGQSGYVKIVYLGQSILRIRGKETGHRYVFGVAAERVIDSNDAQYFVENRTDFKYVESDIDKTSKERSSESTETIDSGNGGVSDTGGQGLPEYSEGLEK